MNDIRLFIWASSRELYPTSIILNYKIVMIDDERGAVWARLLELELELELEARQADSLGDGAAR